MLQLVENVVIFSVFEPADVHDDVHFLNAVKDHLLRLDDFCFRCGCAGGKAARSTDINVWLVGDHRGKYFDPGGENMDINELVLLRISDDLFDIVQCMLRADSTDVDFLSNFECGHGSVSFLKFVFFHKLCYFPIVIFQFRCS